MPQHNHVTQNPVPTGKLFFSPHFLHLPGFSWGAAPVLPMHPLSSTKASSQLILNTPISTRGCEVPHHLPWPSQASSPAWNCSIKTTIRISPHWGSTCCLWAQGVILLLLEMLHPYRNPGSWDAKVMTPKNWQLQKPRRSRDSRGYGTFTPQKHPNLSSPALGSSKLWEKDSHLPLPGRGGKLMVWLFSPSHGEF